jgi:hypothetical protein
VQRIKALVLLRLVVSGLVLLPAACAAPPGRDAPVSETGGERAIDAARGGVMPEYGRPGNNTGTWGGQQLPNINLAPQL